MVVNQQQSRTAPAAPAVQTDPRSAEQREKLIVQRIMDRYKVSEQFDRPFKDAAMDHWRAINNILPDDWPYYSRFFEPETQNACWDAIEGIMGPMFQKDQYFDLVPVEDQDEVQVEIMREIMRWTLREKLKYKLLTFYQLQEAVFFGNGVVKLSTKPRVVTDRRQAPLYTNDPLVNAPVGYGMQESKRLEIWPFGKVVSRFDQYPGPTGATINQMPYFIERSIMPLDYVKAISAAAGFANTDKIQGFMSLDRNEGTAQSEWGEDTFDLYSRLQAVGYDVRAGNTEGGGNNAVQYAELLIYTEAPAHDEGCSKICIVADRQHLLKEMANPFAHGRKPYYEIKYSPRSESYWQAKGVAELIESQQVKVNTRISQIGDIIEEQKSPMTLVGSGAGVRDLSELESYPRSVVRVNDPNQIRWRETPRVPPDMWQDLMGARASIQRSGGALDYSRGVAGQTTGLSRGTETARGLSMLLDAANQAKSFRWLLAEETGISDGLNMAAVIIQQTITTPQKIRILGENRILNRAGWREYLMVNPEDIAGRWDFYAVGASRAADSGTQAELLIKAFELGGIMPDVAPRLKQREGWAEIAEMSGVRNPGRFVLTDEEYALKMQEEGDPTEKAMQAQLALEQAQIDMKTRSKLITSSIKYAEAPPDIRMQLEMLAGLKPSQLYRLQQYIDKLLGQTEKAHAPDPDLGRGAY